MQIMTALSKLYLYITDLKIEPYMVLFRSVITERLLLSYPQRSSSSHNKTARYRE